jgi:hypothetical protein
MMFVALAGLLLLGGCSGYRNIEVPDEGDEWATRGPNPGRMYVRRDEGKYVIKEEPYSIKSKKKDPELLGPQRTYTQNNTAKATATAASTPRPKPKTKGITKSECISLIGEEKFNTYVQKYGGEKGALRRCLILKRLRG